MQWSKAFLDILEFKKVSSEVLKKSKIMFLLKLNTKII